MSETTVFFTIVCGGLLLWFLFGREKPARYRKKNLLTGRERDFFYRLRRALPDCLVFPRMPLSALIEPTGIGRVRKTAHAAIEGLKVGYAVFDMDMRLVAVVELDHGVRMSRRAAAREAYLDRAGIRIVRFPARKLPSETNIHATIYARSASQNGARVSEATAQSDVIEFIPQRSPWRNTLNAHM
ncbi:DUF2726 domain-containing protein [Noviherbaspirillum sp.]|jgi:hypothetical protein|uniref:DUF2726 domain-containing protein n=1 Tax=Noviherbaspirillum sp. TaxID=1926288 RepID=UPI0025FE266D|nr:DUF2726 domain-containing protein [Noviherbaspirillum sp.]